jgi:hypothetical protein
MFVRGASRDVHDGGRTDARRRQASRTPRDAQLVRERVCHVVAIARA